MYGTPVFTTMGGQSRCPGETFTNRRESEVRISDIRPRCGTQYNGTVCTNTHLSPGQKAHFGIIIENTSPTGKIIHVAAQILLTFEALFLSNI